MNFHRYAPVSEIYLYTIAQIKWVTAIWRALSADQLDDMWTGRLAEGLAEVFQNNNKHANGNM